VAPGKLTLATLVITGPGGNSSSPATPGGEHGGHFGPLPAHGSTAHGPNETYYLRYGLNQRMDVGVGYWSDPGKARPAINWQAAREQESRPALLLGYGSEPMGEWRDDGVYVSLLKGFGPPGRRLRAFAAYFREIDGRTNHLIGGLNQSLGPQWSLFVGRYPFNSWHAAATYQLGSGTQFGLWANDFTRTPRLGISFGVGWQVSGRSVAPPRPPDRPLPGEAKQAKPGEETATLSDTTPAAASETEGAPPGTEAAP
jgi:hypothetical protein